MRVSVGLSVVAVMYAAVALPAAGVNAIWCAVALAGQADLSHDSCNPRMLPSCSNIATCNTASRTSNRGGTTSRVLHWRNNCTHIVFLATPHPRSEECSLRYRSSSWPHRPTFWRHVRAAGRAARTADPILPVPCNTPSSLRHHCCPPMHAAPPPERHATAGVPRPRPRPAPSPAAVGTSLAFMCGPTGGLLLVPSERLAPSPSPLACPHTHSATPVLQRTHARIHTAPPQRSRSGCRRPCTTANKRNCSSISA